MADAPKFGGPKPGGSSGSTPGGGAVGIIFLMFILAFAIYVLAVQPIPLGLPGGRTINIGNWLAGRAVTPSGRTDIPVGYTEDQLSPNFKKVRIVSFTAARSGQPATLGLALTPGANQLALSGWQIKTNASAQIIGTEGALGQNWRIPLGSMTLNAKHDRLLLFDAQGLLVDEYSY